MGLVLIGCVLLVAVLLLDVLVPLSSYLSRQAELKEQGWL